MKLTDLLRTLEGRRDRISEISEKMHEFPDQALSEMEGYFSSRLLADLFFLNATALKGTKRASGRPYCSHPASAATLLDILVGGYEEHKKDAIRYALTHDLIDEALNSRTERFGEVMAAFQRYPRELDAAVLLSGPTGEDLHHAGFPVESEKDYAVRVANTLQVLRYGKKAHAYSLIADKLDNLLDLGFLKDRPPEIKNEAVLKKFATPLLFSLESLSDRLESDFQGKIVRLFYQVISNYKITQTEVTDEIYKIRSMVDEQNTTGRAIYSAIDIHHKKFRQPLFAAYPDLS